MFGTDTALVSVRLLTSVELRSPVTTVEPGCLLPLYLWGQVSWLHCGTAG